MNLHSPGGKPWVLSNGQNWHPPRATTPTHPGRPFLQWYIAGLVMWFRPPALVLTNQWRPHLWKGTLGKADKYSIEILLKDLP